MEKLLNIMSKLRDPNTGCPWDIEQNLKSITKHTLEEAYEVVDAIYNDDMDNLKEELGDLLLQVVFYCQIASESGAFNFNDVVSTLNDKLIRRHPHVFGTVKIENAAEQEQAWEKHKELENKDKFKSRLDGITASLPAILKAVKLQKKAAKLGFDWDNLTQVFDKIEEELAELKEELEKSNINSDNIEQEMGDVLFAITNLARKLNVDPEIALTRTNNKFKQRFNYIEKKLERIKKEFSECDLEELDKYWDEAKITGI